MLYIKNGTLHTAVRQDAKLDPQLSLFISEQDTKMMTFQADILIEDGKIKEIGTDLTVPDGCNTLDATGLPCFFTHLYKNMVKSVRKWENGD